MSSRSRNSRKRPSVSGGSAPTPNTKPSDSQYAGKIIDAGIFPEGYRYLYNDPEPPGNMDEILERLASERSSLSPDRFTEQDFRDFKREVAGSEANEKMSLAKPFSIIEGERARHYKLSGVFFNHMKPFRDDIADAQPDAYDGVVPRTIERSVRDDLDTLILPSNDTSRAAAPNFFLEAKKPGGSAAVAKLQAAHNGAIGARAVNSLQNHKRDVPQYDGNAYSYTNTYHDGTLKMYATHPTLSQETGEPEYHMTQLRSFSMTDNSKTFREGATSYRNARDLAAENRDTLIRQANDGARRMPEQPSQVSRCIPGVTPSSDLSTSRTSRSTHPDPDSDTSLDELAREEVTPVKRSRRSITSYNDNDQNQMSFTASVGEARHGSRRIPRGEDCVSFTSTAEEAPSQRDRRRRAATGREVQQRSLKTTKTPKTSVTRVNAKRAHLQNSSGRRVTLGKRKVFIADDE